MLPKTDIKVTVGEPNENSKGSEVWIYLINNAEISGEQHSAIKKTGDWDFRTREEWGYGNNTIIGGKVGDTLVIPIEKAANGGISFWCQAYSGSVEVEANNEVKHYDLYSEEGTYLQVTPFEDNYSSVVVLAIIYALLTCLIATALMLFIGIAISFEGKVKEPRYKYWAVVLGLFVCTYCFDIIWYKHGITNFNAFGDQPGYWQFGGALAKIGITKQEVYGVVKSIICFRGYGIFLPSFIAQFIGNRLHIDSYLVYFCLPSLVSAFLFGYVLPKIYEIIHKKKVRLWKIIFAFISFFFFYTGNLVSIDGDLFGLAFYMGGTLFAILIFTTGKIKYAILSGVLFSLCLAIRTSYLVGVLVLFGIMILYAILTVLHKTKERYIDICEISLKKCIGLFFAFSISFLIVCVPQVYINAENGHYGLFAYDKDGVYGTKTTTLLEQGVDFALRGELTGYPHIIRDEQIHSIRQNAAYDDNKEITMAQGFDAYAKKPLDTLVAIVKRVFAFVDIKFNTTLPDKSWSANTKFYLFSTINYLFIATALFTLLDKRVRGLIYIKADLILWGTLLIGPVAPLLAARIEWRQAMVAYLFYLSYACAFCFSGCFFDKDKRTAVLESNYFAFLTCCVLLFHAISLTMYHLIQ